MKFYNKQLTIGTAVVAVFSLIMDLWLLDFLVRFGVRDQMSLRKRNQVREIFLKIPFPLYFKIYFFNVTNPQDVQNGAIPILQEIGPYYYNEFKERINIVDNKGEDSLTYTPYDIFKFNQEMSGELKDTDYVTIIHPFIVGIVNYVMVNTPAYISIINKSIPNMLPTNADSLFLTAKVKDILFDGIEIDCTTNKFPTSAVCVQLQSQIPGLKVKENNEKIFLFSLLGMRNATKSYRIKILRGILQIQDLGRLMEVNGKKEINLWRSQECNIFHGTDGWIFPPLLKSETGLESYSVDLCRNIKLKHINDTTLKKLNVRIYEANLGDQMNESSEKCYCPLTGNCQKKGTFDVSKCMGVPIIATLPHFLHTDSSYLKLVNGLKPNEDKHSLRVYFEPITGTPIRAYKRMQFNFDLQNNQKISLFSNLSNCLFPLIWIEEESDLEGPLLKKLQLIFLFISITRYFFMTILLTSIMYLGFMLHQYRKNNRQIQISQEKEMENERKNMENDNTNYYEIKLRDNIKINKTNNKVLSGHEFEKYQRY